MTHPRVRLTVLVAVVAVLAGLAAACGNDSHTAKVDSGTTTGTIPARTEPGTTTPPTVAPTANGVTLNVYFVRAEALGVGHRRVAPTTAVGRAALEQMIAGPTADERAAGLSTAIPTGTRLLGLDITDRIATVDLSGEFQSGGGTLSMRERLAQVVFTITQFPTVDKVQFKLDGKPISTFGGEGILLDHPVGRSDFTDVTPFILVETPAPGDTVTSPVKVAGLSNTFESNVRIQVKGADGTVLADTFTTGRGQGTWGPFEASVPFTKGAQAGATVVVFETSGETGAAVHSVTIPVRLG